MGPHDRGGSPQGEPGGRPYRKKTSAAAALRRPPREAKGPDERPHYVADWKEAPRGAEAGPRPQGLTSASVYGSIVVPDGAPPKT